MKARRCLSPGGRLLPVGPPVLPGRPFGDGDRDGPEMRRGRPAFLCQLAGIDSRFDTSPYIGYCTGWMAETLVLLRAG